MRRLLVGPGLLAAATLLTSCAGATAGLTVSPTTPEPIAASLERMPAASSQREAELTAQLLAAPEAVPTLVGMLGSTAYADDAAARYGLEAMVRLATRPGSDPARARLAADLATELDRQHPIETRRFVIAQLERLGDPGSVVPLARLLPDQELGDAAARALVGTGGPEAVAAVVAALRQMEAGSRPELAMAAARLGAEEAEPLLRRDLGGNDSAGTRVAAAALAELAVPASGEALVAAVRKAADADRRALAAEALRYATRVPDSSVGAEVARSMLRLGAGIDDVALQVSALSALAERSPGDARTALESVGDDAPVRLQAAAAALRGELDAEAEARERAATEAREGFVPLFNGTDLEGWVGATEGYYVQGGAIVCDADGGGNLYTADEYSDFVLRFEFRLSPGANNGLGIRAPLEGDAAYVGMELQILDNEARRYAELQPYQYHGSVYGVAAAERGHQRPPGEWNQQEVVAHGRRIRVTLNGVVILDTDLDEVATPSTIDGRDHPGLARTTGHIGFLGHGHRVEFRNLRIREIR